MGSLTVDLGTASDYGENILCSSTNYDVINGTPNTMRLKRRLIRAVRRSGLLLVNRLLGRDGFYRLVGWANRRFGFLVSVFVAYPASAEYASYYFAPSLRREARWSPVLCAAMRQSGRWVLGFGITSLEADFRAPASDEDLRALVRRAERIRRLVGARHVTFSGILPGVLHRRGIARRPVEAEVTARVVARSIECVREAERMSPEVPLIVLGGRGYVGSRLVEELSEQDRQRVYPVDTASASDPWPAHLEGRPAILVNVASKGALRHYLDRLWPGLVLLNEVYPEPPIHEVGAFAALGSAAYHVVGVEAQSWPRFPKAYAGGIPCCAGWPCGDPRPLIRKLIPEPSQPSQPRQGRHAELSSQKAAA